MAAADAQTDAHVDARVLARLSAVVESRRGGDPDASVKGGDRRDSESLSSFPSLS